MQNNTNELAKKMFQGEWLYYAKEKILKKVLGSDEALKALGLIDEEGYLDSEFKLSLTSLVQETFDKQILGPFGDEDIFSGDVFDNETIYNIEIHNIDLSHLNALQKNPGISIKEL